MKGNRDLLQPLGLDGYTEGRQNAKKDGLQSDPSKERFTLLSVPLNAESQKRRSGSALVLCV